MNNIIQQSQQFLLSLLRTINSDIHLLTSIFADICSLNIWHLSFNPRSFTFIDLIKGLVPSELSSCILRLNSNISITRSVISNLLNFIYNSVLKEVWLPRCVLTKSCELSNNITTSSKRSRSHNSSLISVSDLNLYNIDYSLDLVPDRLFSWSSISDFSFNTGKHFSLFMRVVTTPL